MNAVRSSLVAKLKSASSARFPVFRGAALDVQTATDHEVMMAGPAETGKTVALCWKLDGLLRETPGRAVLVRKVRQDMGNTVLKTWERIIAIRGGVVVYGGGHPEKYIYANGSEVYVVGMDRPGAVLSGEFSYVCVNQAEELTLDAWETLSTRCTGRGVVTKTPMLMGDCNPGPPSHWILKRAGLRIFHSKHQDNPSLFGADGIPTEQWTKRTLPTLDSLTGVRKERLRWGRWLSAEGVVYDEFDRGVHVIEPFGIPSGWRRIRSIDFGFSHPFVCLWIALDDDGRMYVYREIHRTKRIVEDHAAEIRRFDKGERIEVTVADHDAEDRATLARHGVYTIAANKAVSTGIQAVQERLRPAGDGKPRLFVFSDALVERDDALAGARRPVSLVEEFESYSWPKDAGGRAIREAPVKIDDDSLDALRYAVMYAAMGAASGDSASAEAGEPAIYAGDDDGRPGWGDDPRGWGD